MVQFTHNEAQPDAFAAELASLYDADPAQFRQLAEQGFFARLGHRMQCALFDTALEISDEAFLNALLDAGLPIPSMIGQNEQFPTLVEVIDHGMIDLAGRLLDAGCDPQASVQANGASYGKTPLIAAAQSMADGSHELMRRLIECGVRLESRMHHTPRDAFASCFFSLNVKYLPQVDKAMTLLRAGYDLSKTAEWICGRIMPGIYRNDPDMQPMFKDVYEHVVLPAYECELRDCLKASIRTIQRQMQSQPADQAARHEWKRKGLQAVLDDLPNKVDTFVGLNESDRKSPYHHCKDLLMAHAIPDFSALGYPPAPDASPEERDAIYGQCIDGMLMPFYLSQAWHHPSNHLTTGMLPLVRHMAWHPLFEGAYTCRRPEIKGYTIECLTSDQDIRSAGNAMRNCLGRHTHAQDAAQGKLQLLAVRDPQGNLVSVASLEMLTKEKLAQISRRERDGASDYAKIPATDRILHLHEHETPKDDLQHFLKLKHHRQHPGSMAISELLAAVRKGRFAVRTEGMGLTAQSEEALKPHPRAHQKYGYTPDWNSVQTIFQEFKQSSRRAMCYTWDGEHERLVHYEPERHFITGQREGIDWRQMHVRDWMLSTGLMDEMHRAMRPMLPILDEAREWKGEADFIERARVGVVRQCQPPLDASAIERRARRAESEAQSEKLQARMRRESHGSFVSDPGGYREREADRRQHVPASRTK